MPFSQPNRPSSKVYSHQKRALALSLLAGLCGGAMVLLVSPAVATVTSRFVLDDAASLSAGNLIATAVHSDGRVTVGTEVLRIAMPEDVPLIYCALQAADGTLYLGTGNEGRVYRLSGQSLSGQSLSGQSVDAFAETGQLMVSALALGPDGTLYAGTLPEGRIYAISPDGQSRQFSRPPDTEHIWALVWHPGRNALIAATGPEGKVYAIDAAGQAHVYWDGPSAHVMSLALGADGAIYAGTDEQALVVRIEGPGQVQVVHDFPGNEITALVERDGVLVVAANEFAAPPRVSASVAKNRSATAGRAPRQRSGKGRVYRIERSGRLSRILARDEGHITSLDVLTDGTVFAGVGQGGRVIRVSPDGQSAVWIDVDERQVLGLRASGDSPYLVTGDGAAIYRIGRGRPSSSIWESKVLDAQFQSRFGQLDWRAQGRLAFQTRSGNTEVPDSTWTGWSTRLTRPGPIRSPRARFLQIRAHFDTDPNAALWAVTAYFLPQNQEHRVHQIRVEGPTKAATKLLRAERQHQIPPAASIYKLAWETQNPDADRMRYRIRYREQRQSIWREIAGLEQGLTARHHNWDTQALADGYYIVRIDASDERDNPESFTLRNHADSEPIRIDNHPPTVERLRFAGGRLRGRALDSLGPIGRLELAVDGQPWRLFFPDDDLFDTATEDFDLDLSTLLPGSHILAVRATDLSGNHVSAELQVSIP